MAWYFSPLRLSGTFSIIGTTKPYKVASRGGIPLSRQEANEQYAKALKAGQKHYRDCVIRGRYPYPQVLDEILDDSMAAGRVDMGLISIPTEGIVGTKAAGRTSAFAANFMPLLAANTEFAAKWVELCMAHLGRASGTPSAATNTWAGFTSRRATSGSASSRATAPRPSTPLSPG